MQVRYSNYEIHVNNCSITTELLNLGDRCQKLSAQKSYWKLGQGSSNCSFCKARSTERELWIQISQQSYFQVSYCAPLIFTTCAHKFLVIRRVHEALGLDRCKDMMSSAAPLSMATLNYFESLNLKVLEFYGATELSGPNTSNINRTWQRLLLENSIFQMLSIFQFLVGAKMEQLEKLFTA